MSPPIELPMAAPGATAPESEAPEPDVAEAARRFRVEGMDCAACAATVQKSVAALKGISSAQVSFGAGTLAVVGEAPDEVITAAVSRAGYRAEPASRRRAQTTTPFWRRDARALSTSASVALLIVAVVASLASALRAVAEPLYLLSMVVGGWPIARAALAALQRRSLDMNVLMALAAVGAVGIGAYAEGAWVLVLFSVGTGLEAMALERSRLSVQDLMDFAPTQVRVLHPDGDEELLDAADVAVGTTFVVSPGERLALDGVVTGGSSSVDQAAITGESVPVDKQAGDEVFAGTLNAQGALTIRVTKVAGESTLSRVAELVEQAQGSRAPAERFVDRFAAVYTPLVFLTALLIATVPLAFGGELHTWLYRALALLIVACPCSLVISVPVAVVSAVGAAARRGILIKGGQALEDLGRIETVALDKTGTLTLGLPRLESVKLLDHGLSEDEAVALVAAVEARSEHPLAAALRRAAADRGLGDYTVDGFEALPGRGAQATVDGRALWAGGPRLIDERAGIAPPELEALHARGETAIALGEGDHILALFGLVDQLRDEAPAVVDQLHHVGIRQVAMLTGDSRPVADAVAQRVGIGTVEAGLLPEDKLTAVEELQRSGPVAMVGDGVNDAPALAAASVGVAMGAAGSDIALKSADVALMSDRLDRLAEAIGLSRRALSIMRVNVVASLVVKGLFVLLAPFGLVTLVVAVAADMGMSLLVTLNALRLIRTERSEETPVAASPDAACCDGCCSTEGPRA